MEAPKTPPRYPQFYRKANRCIKRDSDVKVTEITLPVEGEPLPVVHQPVVYQSTAELDQVCAALEPCDKETYEGYLSDFFRAVQRNRDTFNDYRQKKHFESLNQKATRNPL